VLDACQDCDRDGVIDIQVLGGVHSAWVVSTDDAVGLGQFYAVTGVRQRRATGGELRNGQDVVVGPNRHVFVSSADNHRVLEYDQTGQYVRDFVPAGSGGLSYPTGLTFGPNGNLFVSSRLTHSVLEYDGTSGAFVRAFVPSGAGGLVAPFGLTFGPNGNLFVASDDDRVLEYDGSSGVYVRDLVGAADNGGLSNPRGMLFKPDGKLLVTSFNTNQVLEYDGQTGAFLRVFSNAGIPAVLVLDGPWGIRLGPDGHVYVSRQRSPRLHVTTVRIFVYDGDSGLYRRSYVLGHDTGLFSTAGFDFVPDHGRDCNLNLRPDACDIAGGVSRDCNLNTLPDECEPQPVCPADLNGDCTITLADLGILLGHYGGAGEPSVGDITGDGVVDAKDLAALLVVFGRRCEDL